MSQTPKVGYRHVLAVDIVALSSPTLHHDEQRKKIEILNQSLLDCEAYKNAQKENMKLNSTGDGFVIGIYIDTIFPIELALQLQEKLSQYNQGVDESHKVRIRMGIHSGISSPVRGFNDEWGEAFIGATRIMSIGEADHILLSEKTASDLIQLSKKYEEILHPVGEYEVKHGAKYSVYSAYGNGFGNSNVPQQKLPQKIDTTSETSNKNEETEEKQLKTHVISIAVKTDKFVYPQKAKVYIRTKLNDVILGKPIDIEVYNSQKVLLLRRKINPSTFNNSVLKSAGIYETNFTMKGFGWNIKEPYTVIARHGNAESQISFMVDRRKPVIQTDKSVYLYGSSIILTVIDPDRNRDSTKAETAGDIQDSFVTIEGSLGKIRGYKLIETGKNTGIFQGIFRIIPPYMSKNGKDLKSHSKGHGPFNGIIPAHQGEQISLTYSNGYESAFLSIYKSNFGVAVILDQKRYLIGDTVTITIVAPDYNFNPNKIDVIGNRKDCKVTISTSVGNLTNYKLVETGKDTGIFMGYFRLKKINSKIKKPIVKTRIKEKGPRSGIVFAKDDDEVTVTFQTEATTFESSAKIAVPGLSPQPSYTLSPLQRISVKDLEITDTNNKKITKIKVNQAIKIKASITNNQNKEQTFAFLVQIVNQDGINAEPIMSSQGLLTSLQSSTQTLTWIPRFAGKFAIQIFVWESIDRPSALCPPSHIQVIVE